jgi:hypothetical protein
MHDINSQRSKNRNEWLNANAVRNNNKFLDIREIQLETQPEIKRQLGLFLIRKSGTTREYRNKLILFQPYQDKLHRLILLLFIFELYPRFVLDDTCGCYRSHPARYCSCVLTSSSVFEGSFPAAPLPSGGSDVGMPCMKLAVTSLDMENVIPFRRESGNH